jgi:hypothetical protein
MKLTFLMLLLLAGCATAPAPSGQHVFQDVGGQGWDFLGWETNIPRIAP